MSVNRKSAIWGWVGQILRATPNSQAEKPAAVAIKLAINEIFRVSIIHPQRLYTPSTDVSFHLSSHSGLYSCRDHRHRRQRGEHADGPGAAEVLVQKNAGQHNGDGGIE